MFSIIVVTYKQTPKHFPEMKFCRCDLLSFLYRQKVIEMCPALNNRKAQIYDSARPHVEQLALQELNKVG